MKTIAKLRFCVIMLIMLALSACATTEKPYRGKLSDAMQVASDKHKGERHLQVPESAPMLETDTESDEALNTAMADSTTSPSLASSQSESIDWKKSFMLFRGLGSAAGSLYQNQNSFMIRAGGENEKRTQSEVYLGYENVSLNSGSSLYQSVNGDLNILVAGIGLKRFFKPWSHKIRPYVSGSAGGAYMFWSYRNSFTTSDGNTLSGDNLGGFTLSAAAGVEIKPVRNLSIAIEANPRMHLWNERTGQGFDNDAFDPLTMMALSVGVSLNL